MSAGLSTILGCCTAGRLCLARMLHQVKLGRAALAAPLMAVRAAMVVWGWGQQAWKWCARLAMLVGVWEA